MEQSTAVPLNPLSTDISAQVKTSLVEIKEVSFNFRRDKDLAKKIGVVDDLTKRPTFKFNVPQLTRAGAIAAFQAGDKTADLILEKSNEAIVDRMRGLIQEKINDDTFDPEKKQWNTSLTEVMFDANDLSFFKIANLPKSERGAGIAKEIFAQFVTDYKESMQLPAAIAMFPDKKARDPAILEKHGIILGGKFNAVRSRKDVIGQMNGFLDIYIQVSPNAEENMQVFEFLKSKAEALLQAENFDDL